MATPLYIVKKWSEVESVVVRAVTLSMVTWSEGCQFVTIDAIVEEKSLHLGSNFRYIKLNSPFFVLQELEEHGDWPAVMHLP